MLPAINVMRLLSAAILAVSVVVGPAYAQQTVKLPAPRMEGGMPLMEAISKRQSKRAFADKALSNETLSNLLWAAFGINRPDGSERTAPSWRGSKETDIYVATAEAVRIYDPATHTLRHVMDGDIRADTGRQPYAATAPLVLIYVADRTRMAEAPAQDQTMYAHVNSAFISQNVYLFAASEGLATVVLGNVEKKELAEKMKLRGNQILTFTQPVGYPK